MTRLLVTSQRENYIPNRDEKWDCLDQKLSEFFLIAGAWLLLPAPNTLMGKTGGTNHQPAPLSSWLERINPSGIILSGGGDPRSQTKRYETENYLIKYALTKRIPLLGICRGMLAIGAYFGANIVDVKNHVGAKHRLIGQINQSVNSYHNLALSEVPDQFDIVALSERDKTLEAMRHLEFPIYAQMWHPEREKKFHKGDLERLDLFFKGKK